MNKTKLQIYDPAIGTYHVGEWVGNRVIFFYRGYNQPTDFINCRDNYDYGHYGVELNYRPATQDEIDFLLHKMRSNKADTSQHNITEPYEIY